jgi:hypothetical protein
MSDFEDSLIDLADLAGAYILQTILLDKCQLEVNSSKCSRNNYRRFFYRKKISSRVNNFKAIHAKIR